MITENDLRPSADEEWEEIQPFPAGTRKHSFVSGDRESNAIRVRFFRHNDEETFLVRAWFGPQSEGPPGYAHGGSQAALLDEAMGALPWADGLPVLAAKIEVNFRKSLPVGKIVTVYTEVEKREGKKLFISGRIEGSDGTVYSDSTGLFIVIDLQMFAKSE